MKYIPSEYDAFGPWIYQVDEIHSLPPLYTGFSQRLESALMVLKIPRDIERADANPDMPLYDAVLGLYDSELLLLERRRNQVRETILSYDQVRVIRNYTCLLSGRLTLYTEHKNVNISFNTVSEDIIRQAVRIIRDNQTHFNGFHGTEPVNFSLRTMQFGFVNEVQEIIAENPGSYLIVYQPEICQKIPRETSNPFLCRLSPMERVHSSFAVLTNKRELIILSRIFFLNRRSTDAFAYHYHYISAGSINYVETEDMDGESGLLRLGTEGCIVKFRFARKNKGIYKLEDTIKRWVTDRTDLLHSSGS